ncbi:MAG: SDR family NAD(P)-dependent oxidoreductase [Chloroflexota bacterium]
MPGDGLVVLITGASSGIGYAAALELVRLGCHVVAVARRADRLQELTDACTALPASRGACLTIVGDVQDKDAMQAAVAQAIEAFGRLNVVIANAGVGHRGALVDADWSDVSTVLQTNIDGVLHTIRAGVPAMRNTQGHRQVIIVSSITYNMTAPFAAVYAASKAFVSSIARSLTLELTAENIRVSQLLLGRVQTEFDERRLGAGRRSGSFPPAMPVDRAVQAVIRLIDKPRSSLVVRWIDRVILIGNLLVPNVVGRRAWKQYR